MHEGSIYIRFGVTVSVTAVIELNSVFFSLMQKVLCLFYGFLEHGLAVAFPMDEDDAAFFLQPF